MPQKGAAAQPLPHSHIISIDAMITFPNAKINLGLNIVSRRPDGYHNIETVFYPIGLSDVLEIVPASEGEGSTLQCYGRTVDCPTEKNLVMKAYRLMEREAGAPAVAMHLYKHIPDGAGLGGGSSDASATMLMVNEIFGLGLSRERLAQMAAKIGADCPFFIYNTPMAASGIGDVLKPAQVSLKGLTLLLVKPDVSVPTAVAYSRVTPTPCDTCLASLLALPVDQWKEAGVKNDFEPSVMAAYPELAAIKRRIEQSGAAYAAMSGSGSAIFGIFDSANMAEEAAAKFRDMAHYVIAL